EGRDVRQHAGGRRAARRLRRRHVAPARRAARARVSHRVALVLRAGTLADGRGACARPAEGSYVASLADAGVARAAQKLGEEAVEAAIAATAADGRLVEEAADVVFHLYVLLAVAGVDVADVEDALRLRAGVSASA